MKKNYLKLLLAGLLVFGGMNTFISCSDENEEVEYLISLNELPTKAQVFLNQFFPNEKASRVERQSIGKVIMYEVDLDNGFDIMFDSQGEWQQVEAPDGKYVPSGIAPSAVEEYVNKNYPDYGIEEINKTGNGYQVEIQGVTLEFNELGECTNTIDNL